MIVRALDADGDWTFGRGKSDYLKDSAAVAQCTQTRLKSFLNDCFFDLAAGIDWWTLLGSKNLNSIALAVKSTILGTEKVTGLLELSTDLDENRNLSLKYKISDVYSTDQISDLGVEIG